MRLLINTASTFKGGGVQVALSFINECRRFNQYEYGVIIGPSIRDILDIKSFSNNFRFFIIEYRPAERLFGFKRPDYDLKKIENEFRPDIVFTTSGPSYWRPNSPHLMGFNLPHYIYPDSPYFTKLLTPKRRMYWWLKSKFIKYYTVGFADAYVVQTDDVNFRLKKWIRSNNIFTVSNTISEYYLFSNKSQSEFEGSSKAENKKFRILILSSYYKHKNLEIVNRIIFLMKKNNLCNFEFVFTLSSEELHKFISDENRSYVINVGHIHPKDCPALYKSSDILFLPTLLECFSANYVEAMSMGLPILTTNLGFAKTICGESALYFEPLDAKDALEKILDLYHNIDLREKLVFKGYEEIHRFGSSHLRAKRILSICSDMISGRLAI